MKRSFPALLLVGALLALTGCAGGNLAFGVTPDQLVGTWSASGELDTELTLSEDGALSAFDWPASLDCRDNDAKTVDNLSESERLAVAGTWETGTGDVSHVVTLWLDNEVCPLGGSMAYVWRSLDGTLAMCLKIPNSVPSDELVPGQVLALYLGDDGRGSDAACL